MREFTAGIREGIWVGFGIGMSIILLMTIKGVADENRDKAILRSHGCSVLNERTIPVEEDYVILIPYQSHNTYVCPRTVTEGDMAWLDDLKKAHY